MTSCAVKRSVAIGGLGAGTAALGALRCDPLDAGVRDAVAVHAPLLGPNAVRNRPRHQTASALSRAERTSNASRHWRTRTRPTSPIAMTRAAVPSWCPGWSSRLVTVRATITGRNGPRNEIRSGAAAAGLGSTDDRAVGPCDEGGQRNHQIRGDPADVDQVARRVTVRGAQVRVCAVGNGHDQEATEQTPKRQVVVTHTADGNEDEEHDHDVAERVGEGHDAPERREIGAVPHRLDHGNPADHGERGRHDQAIEQRAEHATALAVGGWVTEQRDDRRWDRAEVSEVGPRWHWDGNVPDEVIAGPDDLGQRPAQARHTQPGPEPPQFSGVTNRGPQAADGGGQRGEHRDDVIDVASHARPAHP